MIDQQPWLLHSYYLELTISTSAHRSIIHPYVYVYLRIYNICCLRVHTNTLRYVKSKYTHGTDSKLARALATGPIDSCRSGRAEIGRHAARIIRSTCTIVLLVVKREIHQHRSVPTVLGNVHGVRYKRNRW